MNVFWSLLLHQARLLKFQPQHSMNRLKNSPNVLSMNNLFFETSWKWAFSPKRLPGFLLNRLRSRDWASGLRNWGIPSLALEAQKTMSVQTLKINIFKEIRLTLRSLSWFPCGLSLGMEVFQSAFQTKEVEIHNNHCTDTQILCLTNLIINYVCVFLKLKSNFSLTPLLSPLARHRTTSQHCGYDLCGWRPLEPYTPPYHKTNMLCSHGQWTLYSTQSLSNTYTDTTNLIHTDTFIIVRFSQNAHIYDLS